MSDLGLALRGLRSALGLLTRAGAVCVAGLLAGCSPPAAAESSTGSRGVSVRPNILILMVDALRPDRLGLHGHDRPTSRFLDALADDSVVFEHAYAQSSQTVFSTASMFVSSDFPLLSRYHGRNGLLLPQSHTFAKWFAGHGYETIGIFTNPNHHDDSGFQQGFEQAGFMLPPEGGHYADAQRVEDRFREWLGQRDEARPFLAYVHYMDVHSPYFAPAEFRERFVRTEGRDRYLNGIPEDDGLPSEADVRYMLEMYDAEIAYTDSMLEKLWTLVGEAGLAENTIVVVCSDHGEEFMEHGGLGHGASRVEQELLRVPLIFAGLPGVAPQRVEALVANLDIAPTLAAAAGLPVPSEWQGLDLYTPLKEGGEVSPEDRVVFARNAEARSATTSAWHAIRQHREPSWRLHAQVQRDRFGTVNLVDDYPQVAQELFLRLEQYNEQVQLTRQVVHELLAQLGESAPVELPAHIREQLEALGYF